MAVETVLRDQDRREKGQDQRAERQEEQRGLDERTGKTRDRNEDQQRQNACPAPVAGITILPVSVADPASR